MPSLEICGVVEVRVSNFESSNHLNNWKFSRIIDLGLIHRNSPNWRKERPETHLVVDSSAARTCEQSLIARHASSRRRTRRLRVADCSDGSPHVGRLPHQAPLSLVQPRHRSKLRLHRYPASLILATSLCSTCVLAPLATVVSGEPCRCGASHELLLQALPSSPRVCPVT
jgi:hypothetical protein